MATFYSSGAGAAIRARGAAGATESAGAAGEAGLTSGVDGTLAAGKDFFNYSPKYYSKIGSSSSR